MSKIVGHIGQWILPISALLGGLILTIWFTIASQQVERDAIDKRFRLDAGIRAEAILSQLNAQLDSAQSIVSLFMTLETVSDKQFTTFVGNGRSKADGIHYAIIIDEVPGDRKDDYVRHIRALNGGAWSDFDLFEGFDLKNRIPVADREVYYPITYMWTPHQRRLPPGLDMAPVKFAMDFVEAAKDREDTLLSGVVSTKDLIDVPSVGIIAVTRVPVRQIPGQAPPTMINRYIAVNVTLSTVITAAIGSFPEIGLDVLIANPRVSSGETEFLNETAVAAAIKWNDRGDASTVELLDEIPATTGMEEVVPLQVGNRTIEVIFRPHEGAYAAQSNEPLIIAIVGSLLTLLLSWATLALTLSKSSVQRQVIEKTSDLSTANAVLEEQKLHLTTLNADIEKAMEAAKAANLAKGQFLANMSHELRTPLNAIIGYSEMLAEDAQDTDPSGDMADDINKVMSAGQHLLGLINDILDLSRIEAERMTLSLSRVDVAAVVGQIAETVKPLMAKGGNHFSYDVAPNAGGIVTDEQRLRQILYNLLSNAAKFTANGTIRLMVDKVKGADPGAISFKVMDTGIGIAADQIEQVFDAFVQADASTTRKFGGSGLGLAITREFAQLLGGSVGATSEVGQGSTFALVLPLGEVADIDAVSGQPATMTEPAPVLSPQVSRPANQKTVLIIDDEAEAREITRRHLASRGYNILEADGGEAGIRMVRKHRPDCILLDIMMPGMNGWSVLEILKADPDLAHVPVMLCTMLDEEDQGYFLGAAEYIHKPIDKAQLMSAMDRLELDREQLVRILIVDDEAEARELLRRRLEADNVEIVEAENGLEALNCLAKSEFSVVLLDLMMPVMDGLQFLEHYRRTDYFGRIPVVVISAKDMGIEERTRLQGRVDGLMSKGEYSWQDLLQEVEALVGSKINSGGSGPAGAGAGD